MNYYSLEKRNEYLGLGQIPVLITDQSDHSDYFNVSSLQPTLTSGKNMFKLTGNSQLLEKGTEIKVELIDVYGTPIFHTVNQYIDGLDRRLVTVWIFDDTPPGPVFVNIVGTAKVRPNGKPVPDSWGGRPNVRWRRKVEVEPMKVNDTPILFNRIPRVFLSEVERGQVSQSFNTGVGALATHSQGAGLYYTRGTQNSGVLQFDIATTPLTSEMIGGVIEIKAPATINAQYESPSEPPIYYANINDITSAQDAQVSPSYNYLATQLLRSQAGNVNSYQTVTAAPTSFFATEFTISYLQHPTTYTTSSTVDSYANIILANIDPMCGDVASIKAYMRQTGTQQWFLADEQTVESKELFVDTANIFDRHPIGKFLTIETYNTYWETSIVGSAVAPTVTLNDTVLMNSMQISGSEELLGAADRANSYIKFNAKPTKPVTVYAGDRYYVSMKLSSLGVVDAISGQQSRPKIRVYVSGSGVNDDGTGNGKEVRTIQPPIPPAPINSNATSPAFPIYPTTIYTPSVINSTTQPTNGNAIAQGRFSSPVFPVAPMTPSGQPANIIAAPVAAFATPTQGLNSSQSSNSPSALANPTLAQILAANPVQTPDYALMDGATFGVEFIADVDGEIVPVFIIENGTWWVADVSIQARAESGFTPNHTFMEAQLTSLGYENSHLDFKFEFYNPVGQKADYIHYIYDTDFAMQNGLSIASGTTEIIGTLILGSGIILQGTN